MEEPIFTLIILASFGLFSVIITSIVGPMLTLWFQNRIERKKFDAQVESIELKNKIAKDIDYKQGKFKGNIQVFQQILNLEKEIKKEENEEIRNKRLEILDKMRESFKESFDEKENKEKEPKKLK